MSDRAAALARMVMRLWLPLTERKRRKALEGAFRTIRDEAIKSEARGFKAQTTLLNIALYFLIAERDFSCIKIDALTHPDPWTRSLCARVILLTIHEWDMDKVSGSALREALDFIQAPDEIRKEAVEALRSVRLVQQRARKTFGVLRNATIAHRDPDAIRQCQAIEEIDTNDVFKVAVEFYAGAQRFINVLPRLMRESATLSALLRQWVAANPEKTSIVPNGKNS